MTQANDRRSLAGVVADVGGRSWYLYRKKNALFIMYGLIRRKRGLRAYKRRPSKYRMGKKVSMGGYKKKFRKPRGIFRAKTFNNMLNKVAEKKHKMVSATLTCRAADNTTNDPWVSLISYAFPAPGSGDGQRIGSRIHVLRINIWLSYTMTSTAHGIAPIRVVIVKTRRSLPTFGNYFRLPNAENYMITPAKVGHTPIMKSIFIKPDVNAKLYAEESEQSYMQRRISIYVNRTYEYNSDALLNLSDYKIGACVPGVSGVFYHATPTLTFNYELVYTDV